MGPGAKATRGWDDEKLVTVLQREKEDAHDYRYFPDPDLVPVIVDDAWLDEVRARLPELPAAKRARYLDEYGLREKDANALLEERQVVDFFEAIVEQPASGGDASAVCKLLLNQMAKLANERGCRVDELGVGVAQVAELIAMRVENQIGAQSIEPLLELLTTSDASARTVADEAGMIVVLDESQLEEWCRAAIEANEQAADDVRNGKMAAIGRLMGHVMKSSGGSADAKVVQAKLRELLG